jgi:hypothetical protein
MSTIITAFLAAVVPSLFCGIVLGFMNRKADRRYEEEKERAQERAEAAQVQMQMVTASAALSYACAVALKRGETNGEVEDAVAQYALAKKRFNDFLMESAIKENVK